jgi:hypothetical protein
LAGRTERMDVAEPVRRWHLGELPFPRVMRWVVRRADRAIAVVRLAGAGNESGAKPG